MKKFDFLETEYHLEKKYLGFTGKGSFTYTGKIQGFHTVVKVNPDWKDCFITINAHKDYEDISLINLLKKNEILKETNISINDSYSFTISYKIPSFSSSNKKRFDEIVEAVISILKRNFYNNVVIPQEEEKEDFSYSENFEHKEKFKSPEEIKKEYDEKKENIFLGILGVIGVCLLAIIAHIAFDIIGINSIVAYIFLASMSCYTYKKLAGKISKKSFIFIFIILIISLFVATVLSFIFYYFYSFKDGGVTLNEAFQDVPSIIIDDSEVRSVFLSEILINGGVLVFLFIASFIAIFREEMEYLKFKKIRK